MSWTDERVELLKKRWAEGVPAAKIAEELGGATRNAVIGKAYRLRLSKKSGRGKMAASKKTVKRSRVNTDAGANNRSSARSQSAAAGTRISGTAQPGRDQGPVTPFNVPTAISPEEAAEQVRSNVLAAEQNALKLSLMELTERTCKWPIGDPATEEFWFCGLPSQPGKPYCNAHIAVAFQPFTSRKDRRANRARAMQAKNRR